QAASGFFDKQSKGYKLLNGISQAFHIAEMARTVVMTVAKIAQGIAAMGAVMAGLGFAMSGGGSGGGKSAEEVQKTQGMLASLKNIEASMSGLTNLVIRGMISGIMGKISSLWGSTKQTIIDSGLQFGGRVSDLQGGSGFNQYASVDTTKKKNFGLSKTTTNSVVTQGLNNEMAAQFGLVFSNLEDTLKLAAGGLGKSADEVGRAIDNMVIQTSTVSLKGLKGEELTDALNAVLSKSMDEIAEKAFPSMDAFRQVGEGYAQTVIRVASAAEQAKLAMEQLGMKAIDYTQVLYKQGDVAVEIAKQTIAMKEGNSGVNDMLKGMDSSLDDLNRKSLL
uniref:Phage tail tape measure protein n=1 Tax=Globodera pallida TaxID=36090 RepID=A0A183CRW8_GLOPA